jgi:hypothetical protein
MPSARLAYPTGHAQAISVQILGRALKLFRAASERLPPSQGLGSDRAGKRRNKPCGVIRHYIANWYKMIKRELSALQIRRADLPIA